MRNLTVFDTSKLIPSREKLISPFSIKGYSLGKPTKFQKRRKQDQKKGEDNKQSK